MKAVLFLVLALVCACYAFSVPNIAGTYVQCDFDSGDKTVLIVRDDTEFYFPSGIQYLSGGCGGGDIDYEINAQFVFDFEAQNDDGTYNITETYTSATVVPRTEEALAAFQSTCPSLLFFLGQETDILSCLFCQGAPQYDLLGLAEDGGFFLGDGVFCTVDSRPAVLNPYEFSPVDPAYYGGLTTVDYYNTVITFVYPTVTYPTVSIPSEGTVASPSTVDVTTITDTIIRRTYYTVQEPVETSNSALIVPTILALFVVILGMF